MKKPQKRRPSPAPFVSQSDTPVDGLVIEAQFVTEVKGPSGGPPGAAAHW